MVEQDDAELLDNAVEDQVTGSAATQAKPQQAYSFVQMIDLNHVDRLRARLHRLDALWAKAVKDGRINDAVAVEKQAGEILRIMPQPGQQVAVVGKRRH